MLPTDMKRLHELEDENYRLKKIVADLALDKELGMQLRNKTPKRRVKAKLREDRKDAVAPNDVWAMGFVHDQLATGLKIRILTVVDTFSRYVPPVLDARFSYKGEDVVTTLDRVCRQLGYPRTIRVDNALWAEQMADLASGHCRIGQVRYVCKFGSVWRFDQRTVSPITNTEYAFAALTVLKTRS